MRAKSVHGFQTGDMVKATVTTGTYSGRVAIRASGSFNIQTSHRLVQGIAHRHCKVVQRADGYGYSMAAITDATGVPPKARTLYLPGLNARVSREF